MLEKKKLENRYQFFIMKNFIFCSILLVILIFVGCLNKSFNKDSWLEEPEGRHKMAKYIIESEMLIGKSKEEVIDLLGGTEIDQGYVMLYYMGYSTFSPQFDPVYLVINFRGNYTVKNVSQREM